MPKEEKYIEIDFYKIWKYIRLNRVAKENIKSTLFSFAPLLFYRFASYQHWKNAQVFAANLNNNIEEQTGLTQDKPTRDSKLAIVLHAFYLDVFKELVSLLPKVEEVEFKLFVSCPPFLQSDINQVVSQFSFPFEMVIVENHGRDIMPFLKTLPLVFGQGFDLVLKLHTKRSNHLNKKDLWSTELFRKLLSEPSIHDILGVFLIHPELGMIGPEGHILPMSLYYGGNAKKVSELCLKMGLSKKQLAGLNFVAGSMFFARKEVLLPILQLNLGDSDFENEEKQLDNTLAHAVERAFAAGLIVSGRKLADTSSTKENLTCTVTLNHPFTI